MTTPIARLEDNFYQVLLSFVYIFFIDDPEDGLIIIDSGYPVSTVTPILEAIHALDKAPEDVKHILITHAHPDHIGNAHDLQTATGAAIWMSAEDAPILEGREKFRAFQTMDGSPPRKLLICQPATVQHTTHHGDILPLAGGIEVIATPGHSLGHQCFLWRQHKGILIMGDATTNVDNLIELPPSYESLETEQESVRKLCGYHFDKIAFSHGNYVAHNGDTLFRTRWK
jgi:glyoxylase-like metal-dependent hydrolase (beta-lactamase superfamily II)